jgi:hypothetical protein
MAEGNYNAVTITVGNKVMRLRESNLRPVWAGQDRSGHNYPSNINWKKRGDGSGVYWPRQLRESHLCFRPRGYCRQTYSSGRMGRGPGQGWGRYRHSSQSQSRSRLGMRWRAWR